MLDELLIHGMDITALEVVGEAGNYAGIKVAKRFGGGEKSQKATGSGAAFGSKAIVKQTADNNNNKTYK